MDPRTLTGKVAIVTGAALRVGAVIARALHAEGMNVVIHYRQSSETAHRLTHEFNAIRPGSATTAQADLLHLKTLPNLLNAALERWGRLDALINNASSFYPTPVNAATETQWEDIVGTNMKAPFFLTQAAADYLAQQQGCVVNIADIHAERPLKGYPIYSAAKAGLVMLTEALARELGPAVRVNAVAPGAILWPERGMDDNSRRAIIEHTALKRQGTPEDIARAVLYLIRDADYVTGHVLTVDGGRSLHH